MIKIVSKDYIKREVIEKQTAKGTTVFIHRFRATNATVRKDGTNPEKRVIFDLVSDTKYIESLNVHAWMEISETDGKPPVFKCTANARNKYDTNVYALAFPFKGVIAPVYSENFRIYKAYISKLTEPLEVEGEKYNNMIYMVVSPSDAAFDDQGMADLCIKTYMRPDFKKKEEVVCTANFFTFTKDGKTAYAKDSEKHTVNLDEYEAMFKNPIFNIMRSRKNRDHGASRKKFSHKK